MFMVEVSFPRTAQKSHLGGNPLHVFRPVVRRVVMSCGRCEKRGHPCVLEGIFNGSLIMIGMTWHDCLDLDFPLR